MAHLPRVLICDDDQLVHLTVKQSLKGVADCRSAYDTDEAMVILRKQETDALILDIQIRTPDEGLIAIPRFRELDPDLAIVINSGLKDFPVVREAMRLGASDYVPKDFHPDELVITLARVLERRSLLLKAQRQDFETASNQKNHILIGKSPSIQLLRKTIERVRQSDANVLIFGETGTGKEIVARQLRKTLSAGSLEPFVAIDSSTIQSATAESILFGHEKGAFTGADRATKGVFEEAHGGAVYFDEIANMPLEIQAKLLRVIQEREVLRLGSTRPLSLSFRVICATNKDLEKMAKEGSFKDDLLQRLNVLPLQLTPLRERAEDIPLLIEHFITRQGRLGERIQFTPEAVETMQGYSWPGNVRELVNVVAYVATMCEAHLVEPADLPPKIRDSARAVKKGASSFQNGAEDSEKLLFYDQVAHFEKTLLTREYAKVEGNVSRLALQLGMDRSHLYSKLKEYGIHGKNQRP